MQLDDDDGDSENGTSPSRKQTNQVFKEQTTTSGDFPPF